MAKSFVDVVRGRLAEEKEILAWFVREVKGSHHANMAENLKAADRRVEHLERLLSRVALRAVMRHGFKRY